MKEPKLRFKGFRGEWETTNIASVASLKAGVSIDTSQEISYQIQGYYPCYGGNGLRGYVRDYTHDGIYNIIGRQGALCGNVRMATGKFHATEHAVVVTPIKKLNPYFLFNVLTKANINQYATGVAQPGLSVQNVNKRLYIHIPNFDEQQSIASYFQHLDSLIQSTTKKIESLKQVKAASLQSMFPQEGETTPRVRFKGFEGEWEKVRASNVFKTFNEKNRPDLPVLSATQDRGMVNRESIGYNIFHDKSNEATYKHILPGQFIIHLRSFQGGFAHSSIEGIASPAYTIMEFKDKTRHFDLYWKYIFVSKEFIKRLELITYGIRDGRSISFEEFSEMYFTVPSYEEQKKIASYITTLDRQITLQTQRLEKLKQIKAACLDNMFV